MGDVRPRRWRRVLAWFVLFAAAGGLSALLLVAGGPWRSESVQPSPPPPLDPPLGLAGEVDGDEIRLTWRPPADEPRDLYYEVFRDGELMEMVATEGWVDRAPTSGRTHEYRVRSVVWRNGEDNLTSDKTSAVRLRTPRRDVTQAALVGEWTLELGQTGTSGGWDESDYSTTLRWRFLPTCDIGACDVAASVDLPRGGWQALRLRRLPWGEWVGSLRQDNWFCHVGPREAILRVRLDPIAGDLEDGRWLVSEVGGSASVIFPESSRCSGYIDWGIRGWARSYEGAPGSS